MKLQEAYIVDGCRTAIGSLRGTLSGVRADDLAAFAIKSIVEKFEIDTASINEVILGCANQAGEDNRNIARMATLLAGLPYTVPAETVNRLCASGMSAVIQASRAVRVGDADLLIAGGVEHMTRAPWVISKSASAFGSDNQMYDTTFGWRFVNPQMKKMYGTDAMGETAENLADLYKISREDQDAFAVWSQHKSAHAVRVGRFAREIIPVEIQHPKKAPFIFEHDEFIKPDTNIEGLARLNPAFRKEGGTVTAGNASGLNDGAAALLISSEHVLSKIAAKPLARIVSSAVTGVEPKYMGIGPVTASVKALEKAGLSLDKMDVIEINEAFAVQVLACLRKLGIEDFDPRVNPNGGAIALGHPLGMSGARILLSAAIELNITNKKYALVTMCIGVGQGYAVILENPNIS